MLHSSIMAPSNPKVRSYLFTWNNPPFGEGLTDLELEAKLVDWFELKYEESGRIKYLSWQLERGAENGTLHVQGYVIWSSPQRMGWSCKFFSKDDHKSSFKVCDGGHAANKTYTSKEETRIEGGSPHFLGTEPQGQGHRTDLDYIKERLDAGTPLKTIAKDHFGAWIRYERGLRSYRGIQQDQRNWVTEPTVLIGPSGTGKSKWCWDQGGPEAYWLHRPNSNRCFWDGYDGQEIVVIDDFEGWLPYNFLLRLLDRYPFRVETKAGSTPMVAKKVFFTSNHCPTLWYKKGLRSLRRRLEGGVHLLQEFEGDITPYELPPDPVNFFVEAGPRQGPRQDY